MLASPLSPASDPEESLPGSRGSTPSPHSRGRALFFCVLGFLGLAGIHRFYVRRWGTGLLMLLTFGGLLIWTLLDAWSLRSGVFRDSRWRILG